MNSTNAIMNGSYIVDELSDAVHRGIAFSVRTQGTIASAGTVILSGLTADKEVHFHGFFIDASDGNISASIYEESTVSAAGTPIIPLNRHRDSANTSTMVVEGAPTVSDMGELIEHKRVFSTGSQGVHLTGAAYGTSDNWVLKPNTQYLLVVENHSAGNIDYSGVFVWDEK